MAARADTRGGAGQGLWRDARTWLRGLLDDRVALALAALLVLLTAALMLRGTYAPTNGGLAARAFQVVTALVPMSIAALLVLRPWSGLVLWVIAMPIVNLLRVQVTVRSVQVIPTSVFIVALAAGIGLAYIRHRDAEAFSVRRIPRPIWLLAAVSVLAALLAAASGAASPDRTTSLTVSLHGLVEPILLGVLVLLLRPSIAQLSGLAVAMAGSVVLATAINVPRFLYIYGTEFEAQRMYFARLTYYNVGIFGDMLVMAIALVVAALAVQGGRRAYVPDRLRVAAVAVAIAALAAATYLTFSKSAWIGGLIVGALLIFGLVRTMRLRIVGLAGILLLSTLLIPYPLLVSRALGGPSATATAAAAASAVAAASSTPGTTPAPTPTPAPSPSSAPSSTTDRTNSFDPTSVEGEMSITERYLATKAALRMSLDHPLFGVGPGRFAVEYAGPYHDPQAKDVLDSAHDLIPEVAATFGLPLALLLGLALLAGLAVTFVVWRRRAGEVRVLAAAYGAALVGFLIVATLFGVDLYRPYRVMNSDVLYAALLLGGIASLWFAVRRPGSGE